MRQTRTTAGALLAAGAAAAGLYVLAVGPAPHQANAQDGGDSRVQEGFAISPVTMNLRGKNPALVGLGSYWVNSTAHCSGCHTWPNWAQGHDPFAGQPKQTNVGRFLAGGRPFNPPGVISRDITPYKDGMPAGLTLAQFVQVLRTGHDPDDPSNPNDLLQIMPWPMLGKLTDRDLTAIYEYLRSIPPIQPGPGAS